MVNYAKLFNLLKKIGLSKTDLRLKAGISTATLAKLSKNENVDLDVIERICRALKVQPGDIFSIDFKTENPLLARLREECEMNLPGGLYHVTQIKLAYNSNHIEGSRLSEDETRYIFETNTIGTEKTAAAVRIDDVVETVNHFDAFKYLLKIADEELSESIIKEFHRILKSGTSDSRKDWFKNGCVEKFEFSKRKEIELKKLLLDYNAIPEKTVDDLAELIYRFESIHPFQDAQAAPSGDLNNFLYANGGSERSERTTYGNGRVGRLILFKECLAHNIVPVLIEDEYKFFYYRGLKEYKNEKGFLRDTILTGQDSYKRILEMLEINL